MADPRPGAHPTFEFVACKSCGQLSRVETCYPTMQASTLAHSIYCPLCGVKFEHEKGNDNGTGFRLVALSILNQVDRDSIDLMTGLYQTWDPYEYPTFKTYIKSLIGSGV